MKIESLEKKLLAENSSSNSNIQYSLYSAPPKISNDTYSFSLGRNSRVLAFAKPFENTITLNYKAMWYEKKDQIINHEAGHIYQAHYGRTTYDLETERDVRSGTRIDQVPEYKNSINSYS